MRDKDGPDAVNLEGYSRRSVARHFGGLRGYSDNGERVILESLAGEMAGRTILDIGSARDGPFRCSAP